MTYNPQFLRKAFHPGFVGPAPPSDPYLPVVLADSPLFYYKLDEPSGSTAADSSGNARDGTWTGTPVFSQPALVNGTSVKLNGASFLQTPPLASISAWTLELWSYFTSFAASNRLFKWTDGATPVAVTIDTSGVVQLTRGGTGPSPISGTLSINTLYHFVLVGLASGMNLYKNGALEGSGGGGFTSNVGGLVTFGGNPPSTFAWAGRMDSVAGYASRLSAARVLAHYNAGL